MPRSRTRSAALAATLIIAASLAGVACGGGDDEPGTDGAEVVETGDPPAKLPRGWVTVVNADGGFTIGIPKDWRARNNGARATIRAPQSVVAVTITADRSDEAVDAPLGEFVSSFAGEVAKRLGDPKVSGVRQVRSPYEARTAQVIAKNPSTGARQRIDAVVVRREGIAAYPMLITRNLRTPPKVFRSELTRMIASLRGRPPR